MENKDYMEYFEKFAAEVDKMSLAISMTRRILKEIEKSDNKADIAAALMKIKGFFSSIDWNSMEDKFYDALYTIVEGILKEKMGDDVEHIDCIYESFFEDMEYEEFIYRYYTDRLDC